MKVVAHNRLLFRYLLVTVAILIVIGSLIVSHSLVRDLAVEERNKIEIWAYATQELASNRDKISENLIVQILKSNTTIPVILYDKDADFCISVNIDLPETNEQEFLKEKITSFQKRHKPIVIEVEGIDQYLYYDDSYTLKRLQLYPYIQLGILAVFLLTAFFGLFSTMKMEQDRLWVGLSKETAHQLGTPISSLLAWIEYLRLKNVDPTIVSDMEKDVGRLQMITDRFSKIGSAPALERENINDIIRHTVSYLERRISQKVAFKVDLPDTPLYTDINEALFGWVIENLTKNAVDAMGGVGTITLSVMEKGQYIHLYIHDTGKGIAKSKFRTIFNPGYTTKSRGWGLGLSLVKRIVESYHGGTIYVKSSEINIGTTFCIVLKKKD